ncbi:MAG: helix-turn-helix transcriptional regulator [Haloferacaceae archaeon]
MSGSGRSAVAAVVAACLLLAGTAAGAAAPAFVPQTGGMDPDAVVLRADVGPDGTASWTIEYRVRLDGENVTAAFEDLQADVRSNRSAYTARFERRMNRTVGAAENATGREMAVRNVTVVAEQRQLPQSYGVVSYRFEWVGFARVDGDRLVVGDALAGLFLDRESRLVVSWPADYEATAVAPGGYEERENAVAWSGPVDFGADEPRVVLEPAGGLPVPPAAVGALVALGVAALAVWFYRRGGDDAADAGTAADGTDGPTAGGAAAGGGSAGDGAAGERAGDGTAGDGADETPETPPEELLSPEERVLKFVRERGGRVKQQEVVSEFDWTAARTSQVVGSLRDDDRIETFRLGRENVLTLPDVEVDEASGGGDGTDGTDGESESEDEGVDWRPE